MVPPGGKGKTLDELHKELGDGFELGTAYTMIAGLLNILAIYDAWGGPVFAEPKRKGKDEEEEADRDESQRKEPAGDAS